MNRRVLIAEDDRIQRRIFHHLLKPFRSRVAEDDPGAEIIFDIRVFEDGDPLVRYFRKQFRRGRRTPLCILDARMLSMSGMESARALRAVDPDVAIIITSAYADVSYDDILENLKDNIHFMRKPLRGEDLLALVNTLLVNWNQRQTLKNAYRRVEQARRHLNMFIEYAPAAVAILDREMRYLAYTRQWKEECTPGHEKLLGRYHHEVFPNIPERWREEHRRCLNGEVIRHPADKYVSPGGDVEYIKRELHPWRETEGEIGGIIIFMEFITDKIVAEQARRKAEAEIRENESYLKAIMDTIQTGMLIIDPRTYRIMDANVCTTEMLGYTKEELIGQDFYAFRSKDHGTTEEAHQLQNEYVLKSRRYGDIHVRRSAATTTFHERKYLVLSLLDITDIKQLMQRQEINIDLAKNLLDLINGPLPRYTPMENGLSLFASAAAAPCYKEGGDHYFVRPIPEHNKTVISLKDQSGHEVGCVLRSIVTDLIHHGILTRRGEAPAEEVVSRLNNAIFHSGLFRPEDFFTLILAEIDHRTLKMTFVSAGHPCFFLIRGEEVAMYPDEFSGGRNMPIPIQQDIRYQSGTVALQPGDKLIFYTDGLSEMPRSAEKPVIKPDELQEIIATLARENPMMSASDLMLELLYDIARMSDATVVPFEKNSSEDDVSIVCLEIESRHAWHERVIRTGDLSTINRDIENIFKRMCDDLAVRRFTESEMMLRAVLSESILNAWKHGNECRPEKAVVVRWRYGNDIHLEVLDEGGGIDLDRVPDPLAPENLMKDSGRGLFIIKKFTENFECASDCGHMKMRLPKSRDTAESTVNKQKCRLSDLW